MTFRMSHYSNINLKMFASVNLISCLSHFFVTFTLLQSPTPIYDICICHDMSKVVSLSTKKKLCHCDCPILHLYNFHILNLSLSLYSITKTTICYSIPCHLLFSCSKEPCKSLKPKEKKRKPNLHQSSWI